MVPPYGGFGATGSGGFRGAGSRGRGGFRGGRGGGFQRDEGPPATVSEMGVFVHACEGDMFVKSSNEMIPYFNAPIYTEDRVQIGKVDEIMGPINEVYFSVKPTPGIQAGSYKAGDKFYISADKLLPVQRFLGGSDRPGSSRGRGGRGGRGGGARGFGGDSRSRGRGGFSRGGSGRGGFRGGARGGFRGGSRGRY